MTMGIRQVIVGVLLNYVARNEGATMHEGVVFIAQATLGGSRDSTPINKMSFVLCVCATMSGQPSPRY